MWPSAQWWQDISVVDRSSSRGKKKKIKWGNWLSLLGRALDGDPATDVLATPGPSKRLAQFHGNAQSIQLGLAQCGADFKEAAKVKVAFKGIFFQFEITSSISSRKTCSNVVWCWSWDTLSQKAFWSGVQECPHISTWVRTYSYQTESRNTCWLQGLIVPSFSCQ